MMASAFAKNGMVHFHNENNEYSKIGGVAYELGKQLIEFASIKIEFLEYELMKFISVYKEPALYGESFWKSLIITDGYIDDMKEPLDTVMQKSIYLYFYYRAIITFVYEYAQDSKQAMARLRSASDNLARINEDLDFYEDLKELVEYICHDVKKTSAFIENELSILTAINQDERLSKLEPLQKLAFVESVRTPGVEADYYLETDYKIRYALAPKNFHPGDYQGTLEDYTVVEMHEISGTRALIKFELMALIKSEIPLKKCKNCDGYFIPKSRSDMEYCTYIAVGETKPCNEIGAMKQYEKKINGDPVHEAYSRAYKRQNSRVRNNKMSQEDFYKWSEQARKMRDDCKAEIISFAEFQDWLDNGKKRARTPVEASKKRKRCLQSIKRSTLMEYIINRSMERHNAFYFNMSTGEFYTINRKILDMAYQKFGNNGSDDIVFADENSEKIAMEYWEKRKELVPLPGENEPIAVFTDETLKQWAEYFHIRIL